VTRAEAFRDVLPSVPVALAGRFLAFLKDERTCGGSKEEREAFPSTEGKNPWTTEAL
jgi:hypothetical protein